MKATKRPPGRPRPKIGVKLVKGIRLLPQEEDQPKPFGCEWSFQGGRPSKFFSTIAALETHIRHLKELKSKSELDLLPTRQELKEWRAFKLGAGGIPAMTILVEWRAARLNEGRPLCSLTVARAVEDYLLAQATRAKNESISSATFRQKRCKLNQFATAFASIVLDTVSPALIEAWIENLENVNADATFNDYRKRVAELFHHYSELVPKNPAEKIEVRGKNTSKSNRHNVRLYSVEVTQSILDCAARTRPYILPRLAAEIFVGLRFTTSALLQRQHVNDTARIFDIPADIMKTRKDHLIDEAPAAYWTWAKLGINDVRCWSMSQTDYMHAKSEVLGRSGIKDEDRRRNALRKGFASYHLAAYSKPGLTAKIMAHKNEGQLWSTYREKATKVDGLKLFKLRPNVRRVN